MPHPGQRLAGKSAFEQKKAQYLSISVHLDIFVVIFLVERKILLTSVELRPKYSEKPPAGETGGTPPNSPQVPKIWDTPCPSREADNVLSGEITMNRKKYMRVAALFPVALAMLLVLNYGLVAVGKGFLYRVTTATDTGRDSNHPSISDDGRWIAFSGDSDFLGGGVLADEFEIWLYDTQNITYTKVTTLTATGRESIDPVISGDGATIAFASSSDLLGQGATAFPEVWLYKTTTMTFTRVTSRPVLDQNSNKNFYGFSLNITGTVLAIESNVGLRGETLGGTFPPTEIWLYDTGQLTFTRVTTATDSNRSSSAPALSGDGQWLAFHSDSDLLTQGIVNGQNEVWLYDTAAMTVTRVTTASDSSNRESKNPSLDHLGRWLVFHSDSDFLGQSLPDDQFEIWLVDTTTMSFTRVTTSTGGGSLYPTISGDGSTIVFISNADFLDEAAGNTLSEWEFWEYNISGGAFYRLTNGGINSAGPPANDALPSNAAELLTVNETGTSIVSSSDRDFLSQGVPANQFELWLVKAPSDATFLPVMLKN
jgi:Tol biopolymer transport system component